MKNKGFTVVQMVITITMLTIIFASLAKVKINNGYYTFASITEKRVETVVNAMQQAYMANISSGTSSDSTSAYPSDIDSLIDAGFLSSCSEEDEESGDCINNAKLPWIDSDGNDEQMVIAVTSNATDNYPQFTITFDISTIEPYAKRAIVKSRLSQIPSFTYDDGVVTLTFQRPGNTVNDENLVARDGTRSMTNDWDFGDVNLNNVKYLNNVQDISIKGVTDRTVLTGLRKTGSLVITSSAGATVTKPDCPDNYTPEIELSLIGLGVTDVEYSIKGFATWKVESSDYWTVYFRSTAENESGTKKYFYEGTVKYDTWCGVE